MNEHTYRMLTDPDEIDAILRPILEANGSEIPGRDCCVAAVEFDEKGEVIAYQLLQMAPFLEGLWSKNSSSHLLKLFHMACKYATDILKSRSVMTMTRNDEKGNRIGRLAMALGLENMNWNVYRRKF